MCHKLVAVVVIHTSFFVFFFFPHQEEFLSLCVDKLTEILNSDFLNVPKEEMVFEAAMLWLNKCSSRKQSFEKVRFAFLFSRAGTNVFTPERVP